MKKYIFIGIIAAFMNACTKEINIDLNSTDPRPIIEGTISTVAGETKVKITKTINFSENAPFPTVSGAIVTISDSKNNRIDTLKETAKGIYSNTNLLGVEGLTYTLTVKIGSDIYSAKSTMPQKVLFESLNQEGESGTSSGGQGSFLRNSVVQIVPKYTDLANVDNYYQFIVTRNDTLLNDIFIRNDVGFNGVFTDRPLLVEAAKNDVVKVAMHCLDKPVYDYFFGLNEVLNQSTATPANPVSNISNGALGYFKAHTSEQKSIIVR